MLKGSDLILRLCSRTDMPIKTLQKVVEILLDTDTNLCNENEGRGHRLHLYFKLWEYPWISQLETRASPLSCKTEREKGAV